MTSDEFRQRRRQLSLTQEQLAVRLGVVVMTVSKWERGIHRVPEPVAQLVNRLVAEGRKAKRKR